ncbi:MAG: ribose-5-phosphate isomerase A [Methylocella sp.]
MQRARRHVAAAGMPLSFTEHRRIDFASADQVACATLDLVRGLGSALLREKVMASASDWIIVIVDETKLVGRVGGNTPLPVHAMFPMRFSSVRQRTSGRPDRADPGSCASPLDRLRRDGSGTKRWITPSMWDVA